MKIDFYRPLIAVSPASRRAQISYVAQQTHRGNKPITDGYDHLLTWGPKLVYVNAEGCPQGSKKPIVMNKRAKDAANDEVAVAKGAANDEVLRLQHETLAAIKALSGNVQALHLKIGLLRRDMGVLRATADEPVEPTGVVVADDMPPTAEGTH